MDDSTVYTENWGDSVAQILGSVGGLAGLSWLVKAFRERRLDNQHKRDHEQRVDASTRSEWAAQTDILRMERDAAAAQAQRMETELQKERLDHQKTGFEVTQLKEKLEQKEAEVRVLQKALGRLTDG